MPPKIKSKERLSVTVSKDIHKQLMEVTKDSTWGYAPTQSAVVERGIALALVEIDAARKIGGHNRVKSIYEPKRYNP